MLGRLRQALGARHADIGGRVTALLAFLIAANLAAWAWALLAFRDYPLLLGTALLAYSFGARHAVDADHIAAIDNVTRKLMQQGRRPIAVGFYFSLGHSTVVVLASAAIAAAAAALETRLAAVKEVASIVGTGVSALFLFAIALTNLLVLRATWRSFARVRRGGREAGADIDELLAQRGLLGRLFRPLFALIGASWHMYPLGFLFGLGFDTATEIGVLGIAAAESSKGLPIWSILVFPTLFTAGMSLVDTADGILMLGAYGWAFMKPLRKLYYNLTITLVSVLTAAAVGSVEALGLIGERLSLDGRFWHAVASLNAHFGALGCAIIALFAASWLVSFVVYRVKRYDEIGARSR
ncbi:MAG TPA: HoxN/HupN/NixA family nickel/cobalt transporter [Stellaceae bacterium]|nr:HoxN/HupN/NixA family nickel/cobalt transporter [Stellaceae bacterium]